jgi:hypothetical protein
MEQSSSWKKVYHGTKSIVEQSPLWNKVGSYILRNAHISRVSYISKGRHIARVAYISLGPNISGFVYISRGPHI